MHPPFPCGCLHFLYSLLGSCHVFIFLTVHAQNTFIPKDFYKKEVVSLKRRMKSSCKHSNKWRAMGLQSIRMIDGLSFIYLCGK